MWRRSGSSENHDTDAAARALACYRRIYWIAGGRAKDAGIEELLAYAPRIAAAYLIGEASELFAELFEGKTKIERFTLSPICMR